MDLSTLLDGTVLRTRTRLQPAGGVGDVIYPPTYGEGSTKHQRRIDGESVTCALLDSVASTANRTELALAENFDLPRLAVEIDGHQQTDMTLPHRACDAILRSCTSSERSFFDTGVGEAILSHDLNELFGYSPVSLLFGLWHSNRKKAVGLKIPRSIAGEIVAVKIEFAPHVASRIDPLPISAASKVELTDDGWKMASKGGKRPSEAMLGNIVPSISDDRGVTMDYAEHTVSISLPSIRSLGLPDQAQRLLVAIGVAGTVLAFGEGAWLRSRCHLVPESPYVWERVSGSKVESIGELTPESARTLVEDAIREVESAKLPWHGVTKFEASSDLLKLVEEGKQKLGANG